jgi:hypothetical protein
MIVWRVSHYLGRSEAGSGATDTLESMKLLFRVTREDGTVEELVEVKECTSISIPAPEPPLPWVGTIVRITPEESGYRLIDVDFVESPEFTYLYGVPPSAIADKMRVGQNVRLDPPEGKK